ncbi:molybdate ABC transporter substrate-binding protein [uncultured Ruegeria sp.]|uniref:molybdate ABC transporter substrate-binding protein n=1 Tax=uncultured Ruegeria sp. TaxID=259304 RepID=UPI0026281127|nr:molybdate ABC transporter substrate-binding protein [uncultured Ruegeria sp.]
MRCLIAVLALCALIATPVRAEGVLVFAAASLKTALDAIAPGFEQETGHKVTVSYAASSVLARQIQVGAPADLFISANQDWMDVLQSEGLIDTASRVDLMSNGLVLIGAPDAESAEIEVGFDLITRLDGGYLAMALVDAVPAGIYGKAALQGLGLWNDVQGQIAQTDNVRAALALVATGAAPLGIVYRSDAIAEDRVGVVGTIPPKHYPTIVYPAALTTAAGPDARAFLTYLQGDAAKSEFLRQGFSLPEG